MYNSASMRLWHQDLIHYLPRQQLLGQHRECAALRGLGWRKKHSVVDYVFKHPINDLFAYHSIVMKEMEDRGYYVNEVWKDSRYRGKSIGMVDNAPQSSLVCKDDKHVYAEHDKAYLDECLANLKRKNAKLVNGKTLDNFLEKEEKTGN